MTAEKIRHVDPLLGAVDPVEVARQHVADQALRPDAGGRVGLELEYHLLHRSDPSRRPSWAEVSALRERLQPLPSGSPITFEPGGQIELSAPPADDVVAAVEAVRLDAADLRRQLREAGYAAAPLGADLARPAQRVNPSARYAAMERHFDAMGCAGCGMAMMTGTAALQVNLDAGPAAGWADRLDLVRSLVPVLLAASSTSPWLGGSTSGWHSMRQGTWQGIDHGRSDPLPTGDPAAGWAAYALDAHVMLVRDGERCLPVTEKVPFVDWLTGAAPIHRAPTLDDLDYHLTTLFPPVRPRGYVEVRALDAMPDEWWPAMAAVTATLIDDPVAADRAREASEPVADAWEAAARRGPADPAVGRAVNACLEIAVAHCPAPLKTEVEALAGLLASGTSPSEVLRARIEKDGPLAVMVEEADRD